MAQQGPSGGFGSPPSVEDVPNLVREIVQQELQQALERLGVKTLHAVPAKPRNGQVAYADGTDWNPGSGQGFYGYVNGAWILLGGAGGSAPQDADYLVKTTNSSLSAERVVTDTTDISWNWATAGQAKANLADTIGTGSVVRESELRALDAKPPVSYCSTTALPSNTYSNGTSGIGATLTGTANGPLLIDGVTLLSTQVGQRVLVTAEASGLKNGWYTITQIGVLLVSPYILTRSAESNQASEIESGYLTGVEASSGFTAGSTNNGKVFISISPTPFVVGTDSISFSSVGSTYSGDETTIHLSGTTFSALTGAGSPLTTKGDIYAYSTVNARLPVGTNNHVLTPDSSQTLGLKWQSLSAQIDAAIGSTQGQLLYRDASAWLALATGTAPNVLCTGGASANPAWRAAFLRTGFGSVTGSAATSFTATPTFASVAYQVMIFFGLRNASAGSTNNISLYYSGDTTAANYDRTIIAEVGGAAIVVANTNAGFVGAMQASQSMIGVAFGMLDMDNKMRMVVLAHENATTNLALHITSHHYRTTGIPSSYTLSGSVASGLDVNSWMNVFIAPTV